MATRGDAPDRISMPRSLPKRRMRLLDRRGFDNDIVELPELSIERETLIRRPGLGDDVDGFLEARLCVFHRDAEADELIMPVALADTEVEAPTGQQIYRRR